MHKTSLLAHTNQRANGVEHQHEQENEHEGSVLRVTRFQMEDRCFAPTFCGQAVAGRHSKRTPRREELISDHPCLKPQHFMRIIVRALLPLREGTLLDPFMGSGSTIAAARAVGYSSIGLEVDPEYFRLAEKPVPRLAALYPRFKGQEIEVELNGNVERESDEQMALTLAETASVCGRGHREGKR